MTSFLDASVYADLIGHYGYAVIFLVVMLESSGLPLPGETVLVGASIYAGTRQVLDVRLVIGAAACGAILGDNIGFWAGRRFGRNLVVRYGHVVGIDARHLALGEYLFARHGGIIVFCGRFVAFLRVYAALLAGTNRLPPLQFAFYNATGGVAWAAAFGLGGYALGKNIERLLGPLGWITLAAAAIGSYFLWSFYKKHEEQLLAKAARAQALRAN